MSQAPLNAEQVNGRPRSPRVVIIGAGFGGIAAAIELRRHGFEDADDPRGRPRDRRHLVLQQLPGRRV